MNNFSRKNLNNIKNICSEKTGVALPETKPISGVKIVSIVIALVLVLTPLTAYGTQYTMNFLEYHDSEKNVKAKALEFVDDFMAFTYGDSETYVDDDGEENSFYDFLRQSAYLFKCDNALKTYQYLGYSVWETIETRVSTVENEENSWYVIAHADVEESNYTGVINEYFITFYLKYDGSGEYFVLTDMYFDDTVGNSESVFGDVGVLDTMHFIAWTKNNDDYVKYIKNISSKTGEVMEKDQAEKFVSEFVLDYVHYIYSGEESFADKEGIIYSVIDNIRKYKVLSGGENYSFEVAEIFSSCPVSVQSVKIDDFWYAEGRIHGEVFDENGNHVTDYGNYMYFKFKEIDGEYVVEDLNMFGANNDSFKIFFGVDIDPIVSFDDFILWADATDDYSQILANSYKKIDDYIRDQGIKESAFETAKSFVDAVFTDGENIWDNGKDDDLTVFIREYVEYLKLSSEKSDVLNYTVEVRDPYLPQTSDYESTTSVRADITEHKADGTEFTYMTKFFFKYDLIFTEPKLVDFYFYVNLPQTHEVFEKVGKNNYSLTDETFIEWAAEHNDYSVYTQKVRDAVAELGK